MPNNRIFYACQAVAIEPLYDNAGTLTTMPTGVQALHGVQSIGLNTTFNLEQVFELGQIHIYENIEGVPDVEVTLEKVLDGFPLMYHVATCGVDQESALSSTSKLSLVARSKQRCNVYLGIFPDTVEHIADAGANATAEVQMSGMYISSISYTLPTDGNCKESLTLVGNHKVWNTSKFTSAVASQLDWSGAVGNLDKPKNLQSGTTYGGIQRRENVDIKNSIFPKAIYGVAQNTSAGNAWNSTSLRPNVHFQNISISTDLNRESIQELGRKAPYYRFANFPVEVKCDFEVIAVSGDFINAYEEGDVGKFPSTNENYGNNTSEETIVIKLHDGTVFDLGTKARLASVNYQGADAGGGNGSMTYSYSTYNSMTVTHPQDLISSPNNPSYSPSYRGA
jgi:hypothetical protein